MRIRAGCRVALRTAVMIGFSCPLAISAPRPSSHPRWAVHVASGKGSSYIDERICGALDYFSGDALRFDYDHDLSGKRPTEIEDKVDSQPIGEVAGNVVQQVTHTVNDGELIMKMILVRRNEGMFCEIYHQQMAAAIVTVAPAYFVHVGLEVILATSDPVSGNGGWREEGYWTFDRDGPIELDVNDRIDEIQKKLLPKGLVTMNGGGFDLGKLTYSMAVWKEGDPHCCPTGGNIEIRFALKDHRLVVVSQSYKQK